MTRSAVRSRLAPPAFAGFASFGSASPIVAKAAAAKPKGRSRASANLFRFSLVVSMYPSREGKHHEIRLHTRKSRFPTVLCRHHRRPACPTGQAQRRRSPPYFEIRAVAAQDVRRLQQRAASHRFREIPEDSIWPRFREKAPLTFRAKPD